MQLIDALRRRPHLIFASDVEQDLFRTCWCVAGPTDTGEDMPARTRETDRAGLADSR